MPHRKQYTEKQRSDALEAIKPGMSQRKASITFGIPRTTSGEFYTFHKLPYILFHIEYLFGSLVLGLRYETLAIKHNNKTFFIF